MASAIHALITATHASASVSGPDALSVMQDFHRPHRVKFWFSVLLRNMETTDPFIALHIMQQLDWFVFHFLGASVPAPLRKVLVDANAKFKRKALKKERAWQWSPEVPPQMRHMVSDDLIMLSDNLMWLTLTDGHLKPFLGNSDEVLAAARRRVVWRPRSATVNGAPHMLDGAEFVACFCPCTHSVVSKNSWSSVLRALQVTPHMRQDGHISEPEVGHIRSLLTGAALAQVLQTSISCSNATDGPWDGSPAVATYSAARGSGLLTSPLGALAEQDACEAVID